MRRIKKDKIRQFSYCFGKSTNALIGSSIPQVQRRTTERIPDLECFKGPANTDFQNNFYYGPIKSYIVNMSRPAGLRYRRYAKNFRFFALLLRYLSKFLLR